MGNNIKGAYEAPPVLAIVEEEQILAVGTNTPLGQVPQGDYSPNGSFFWVVKEPQDTAYLVSCLESRSKNLELFFSFSTQTLHTLASSARNSLETFSQVKEKDVM